MQGLTGVIGLQKKWFHKNLLNTPLCEKSVIMGYQQYPNKLQLDKNEINAIKTLFYSCYIYLLLHCKKKKNTNKIKDIYHILFFQLIPPAIEHNHKDDQ
jgi:hypothetical protein